MVVRESPGAVRLRAAEQRAQPKGAALSIARDETLMSAEELSEAETVIQQGQRTFVQVGQALSAICDGKGYRFSHGTFEDYLHDRWGWTRAHGYNVMSAARAARNVLPVIHSAPTLAQALALAPLPDQEQRAIVQDLGDLNAYSTRRLRQEIKDRRVGRVRDARREMLASAPPSLDDPDRCWIDAAEASSLPGIYLGTDLYVTSPPYGLGVDGSDQEVGLDWQPYLGFARSWASELYANANAAHGRLCLNVPLDRTKGSREPVYADWLQVLRQAGWTYDSTIVWKEGNVSNHQARGSVASPNAPHAVAPVEMILVMYRGQWDRGEPQRPSDIRELDWIDWLSSTWSFAGEHRYRVGHMAPFPEELPRRCILLFSFPGDVVGDPFVGSGTSAVAALKLGRRFRGSDIDPECVALSRARVAREVASCG